MTKKIRVGLLFGGQSAEHEVSLQSAKNIVEAIDKNKYELFLIGIDQQGRWYLNESSQFLLHSDNPKLIKLNKANESVALVPGKTHDQLVHLSGTSLMSSLDVVFPILHGPFGEDGTIQGLLKLANVAYVGASVLGSAVGMDKDVMKRLLRDAGLPIGKFLCFHRKDWSDIRYEGVTDFLGSPVFVKPANLGSSVGISKVNNENEFQQALKEAFQFDRKILIESFINGREIECAVLGNENPMASIPGEITPQHPLYSYDAKYIDDKGALLEIPAQLTESLVKEVQKLALKTFQTLCCEGMARVDFFLTPDQELFVNEINTIPGFTKISMYPQLWNATGIPYSDLIDRLIQLALERREQEKQLKTSKD